MVMKKSLLFILVAVLVVGISSCAAPLNKRESGGLIGLGLGAGSGAIIGSTVGHAAAGAAIGGPVGLIAGALIGDQLMMMAQQNGRQTQYDSNQAELERLRRENRRLRERLER